MCDAISYNSLKQISGSYKQICDDVLWDVAKKNLVDSIVGHALLSTYNADEIPIYWSDSHTQNYNKISAYLKELDRISDILSSEDITLVALKNGGIARAIHPCPGCVPMGDLDTLVRRSDFKRAHKILTENGYKISAPNPLEEACVDYGYRTGGSEYEITLPDGRSLWFELQWRPIAGKWLRPDQEPEADVLLERSVGVPGSSVRILSPEDNLVQVALHTAKHSYVRAPGFRLHLDVDRIVNYQHIDWDIFLNRVRLLQIKVPVYFSLLIPKIIFGTPIPDEIFESISPPKWKEKLIGNWLQRVGLFNPHESKFGKISYIVFTGMLYDNLSGLLKGVFPDPNWVKERYGSKSNFKLLYYYPKRLFDLIFKRMST